MTGDEVHAALPVEFTGPRVACDALKNEQNAVGEAIRQALRAVLPSDTYIKHFTVRTELVEIDPAWRSEFLEVARGRGVDNQAATARVAHFWKNLRFRSKSEVRIAEALDRAGVLYLPNCRTRLGRADARQNREPTSSSAPMVAGASSRLMGIHSTRHRGPLTTTSVIACSAHTGARRRALPCRPLLQGAGCDRPRVPQYLGARLRGEFSPLDCRGGER